MKSFHSTLVQKAPGQAHREVKVYIDWEGISREDLIILARDALLYNLQFKLKKDEGPMPEVVNIVAREMIHHELPCMVQFQPPPIKFKFSKELEEALKSLTPEEQKELLS